MPKRCVHCGRTGGKGHTCVDLDTEPEEKTKQCGKCGCKVVQNHFPMQILKSVVKTTARAAKSAKNRFFFMYTIFFISITMLFSDFLH